MIKYIVLGLTLGALAAGKFFQQDVSLQIKAPPVAEAGSTIDVEVSLTKSGLTGFARFQQKLPYGITASPVYPADMNFSFEDNTLTMIWLNLPGEDKVTANYRIHINERLKGDLHLDGTFSYIRDNQRMTAGAEGMTLTINPSPAIDENLLVDVSEAGEKLLSPAPPHVQYDNVVAVRQEPVPDNDLGFIVNILVNKGGRSHFAKIEETIPAGYTAFEIENRGGIFSFSDRKARIIWRNLPIEESFIVSYRVIPDNDRTAAPAISGEFSFMHNEVTASREIMETDRDLVSMTGTEQQRLIASLPGRPVAPVPSETSVVSPVPAPALSPSPPQVAADRIPVVLPGVEPDRPLQAESGIYYRVQIAAGRRPVDIVRYFGRYNISDDIQTEIHEGWIKYTVGSYHDYRSARDSRVNIWHTTPIYDAFVSAYNDGRRITVQEALMIANHQWYR